MFEGQERSKLEHKTIIQLFGKEEDHYSSRSYCWQRLLFASSASQQVIIPKPMLFLFLYFFLLIVLSGILTGLQSPN